MKLEEMNLYENALVLYDGTCIFCNSTVQYIIDHDPDGYHLFSPLDSSLGMEVMDSFSSVPSDIDSIVLIDHSGPSIYSTAVLKIFKRLKIFGILSIIVLAIPAAIRDYFYRVFAKRRHAFFGKKDACIIPSQEIRKRFIFD